MVEDTDNLDNLVNELKNMEWNFEPVDQDLVEFLKEFQRKWYSMIENWHPYYFEEDE